MSEGGFDRKSTQEILANFYMYLELKVHLGDTITHMIPNKTRTVLSANKVIGIQ